MPTLHLLQIALNDYDPASSVPSLKGCLQDIENLHATVQRMYGAEMTIVRKKYENSGATRAAVIKAFEDLAEAADPGDSVLIQYSGHGSENISAVAFRAAADHVLYDQTLVLYDSRLPDGYDLADKELAVLLSNFKNDVQVVFLADSCHAGTITRDLKGGDTRARFVPSRPGEPRPLESYLNGYYLDKALPLQIPEYSRISVGACSAEEVAYEAGQGVFTQALTKVLEASGGDVSYAELFERVRTQVLRDKARQTPFFDVVGQFDSNRLFLKRSVKVAQSYQVTYDFNTREWKLMQGAIHGLKPEAAAQIALYPADKPDAVARIVPIREVRMAHSVLAIDQPPIDGTKEWRANFASVVQPNILFRLEGEPALTDAFIKAFRPLSPFYALSDADTAKYHLVVSQQMTPDGLLFYTHVYHTGTGKLLHAVEAESMETLAKNTDLQALAVIEKWERLQAVESPVTALAEKTDWYIELQGKRQEGKTITVEYSGEPVPFSIVAKNNSDWPQHFTLLQFNRNYTIMAFQEEREVPIDASVTLRSEKFLIAGDAPESTVVFKFIAGNRKPDAFSFEQKTPLNMGNIDPDMRSRRDTGDVPTKFIFPPRPEEWHTDTMVVKVLRKQGELSRQTIHAGAVDIRQNPSVTGQVGLNIVGNYTRSSRRFDGIAPALQARQLSLFELAGDHAPSAIEFRNLTTLTPQQPLQLQVTDNATAAVPVTFDGEFMLPFGNCHYSDGTSAIEIPLLPESDDASRQRNLGRAALFALLKIGLNADKAVFKLRRVNYSGNPPGYDEDNLPAQVARAGRILLLLHGFLGNTGREAEYLRASAGQYDLVLAFDYENLNSTIDDIALRLQAALLTAGIKHADGKQLTIVGHSLGGLIGRVLVEDLYRDEDTVDALILIGTPNGGTLWHKTATWANYLNVGLGLALNFTTGPIGAAVTWMHRALGVLTPNAFVTLKDMAPDSAVMQRLGGAKAPLHTRYKVIAGDAHRLQDLPDQRRFRRFCQKLGSMAGNWMYEGEPSDLFASVTSQLAVPFVADANKIILPAHHYGYFESESPLISHV